MKKFLLAAAISVLCIAPVAASAQSQNCAPRERVVERLASQYGETRQSRGLGNNALVEIWANTEEDSTGSWTITVTRPNGVTCLIASGQAFETLNEPLVEGDPT